MKIDNDKLKRHIFFSDPFSKDRKIHQKRKEHYLNMIMAIIRESRFLYTPDYYKVSIDVIEADMANLDYCIDLYPTVGASTYEKDNRIIVNLFSLFAANHTIMVIEELIKLLTLNSNTPYEEISSKALNLVKSNKIKNMNMISDYIDYFASNRDFLVESEHDKTYAVWPEKKLQKHKYSGYAYDVFKLIFLHEFGHWQYARFNKDKIDEFFSYFHFAITKNFSETFFTNENISFWIEEIIADYIALMVFTKQYHSRSKNKQCIKECYIAIGLYYGLLAMEELPKEENSDIFHPPIKIRQNTVKDMYALFLNSNLGISYTKFIKEEIIEWHIIQEYFFSIIEKYRRWKNG